MRLDSILEFMNNLVGRYAQNEGGAQDAENRAIEDLRKQNEALQAQLAQLTGVIAGLNDTINALTTGGGSGG